MEKKYLVIKLDGQEIGAFENVRNVEEGDGFIKFDSDDGSFVYVQNILGEYACEENDIYFDSYEIVGRRTLRRRTDDLDSQKVKRVNL